MSKLLIEEADAQLKREDCPGLGNARVMYAALEVLFQSYAELKDGEAGVRETAKAAVTTASEKNCEATITNLAPREGSSLPTVRVGAPGLGGGGKGGGGRVQYIPEVVLATLFMSPGKRAEYLAAISPETNESITAWKTANAQDYRELAKTLQLKAIDLNPALWGNFDGYKIPDGSGTWIIPKDGGLNWPSAAPSLGK